MSEMISIAYAVMTPIAAYALYALNRRIHMDPTASVARALEDDGTKPAFHIWHDGKSTSVTPAHPNSGAGLGILIACGLAAYAFGIVIPGRWVTTDAVSVADRAAQISGGVSGLFIGFQLLRWVVLSAAVLLGCALVATTASYIITGKPFEWFAPIQRAQEDRARKQTADFLKQFYREREERQKQAPLSQQNPRK
jgi:hypothetical protein